MTTADGYRTWLNCALILSAIIGIGHCTVIHEEDTLWYQMAFPASEKSDLSQPVRLFVNNILMWRWSGRVDDGANYAPPVDIVCPTDHLILESQPDLTYIINEKYISDTFEMSQQAKNYTYNKESVFMRHRAFDETCESDRKANKSRSLTFKTQSVSADFLNVSNWVKCEERAYCKALLDRIGLGLKSGHSFFDFPLDTQLIPTPTSQFFVADIFDGPDIDGLKNILHEQPKSLNLTKLTQDLTESDNYHRIKTSLKVSICDHSLTERICENFEDLTPPKCEQALIKPKCSCRSYCGTMLQTKKHHNDVAEIHDIINNITKPWTKKDSNLEPKESKNMVIVQQCPKGSSKCYFYLQLVFNDSLSPDISSLTDGLDILDEPYILNYEHSGTDNGDGSGSHLRMTIAAKFLIVLFSVSGLAFLIFYFWKRSRTRPVDQPVQMADISDNDIDVYGHVNYPPSHQITGQGSSSGGIVNTVTSKFFGNKEKKEGFNKLHNSSSLDLIQDVEDGFDEDPVMFNTSLNVSM